MNTQQIEKQTKAEFYRQAISSGLRFHGSAWNRSVEEVAEKLGEVLHPEKAEVCKVEKHGSGIRRYVSEKEAWSYTDLKKETTVFKGGNFWILFSDYGDSTCAVAYSIL